MPRINDLELPIKPPILAGPAVDEWKARKEDNNDHKFSAEEMDRNYRAHKDDIFADLDAMFSESQETR